MMPNANFAFDGQSLFVHVRWKESHFPTGNIEKKEEDLDGFYDYYRPSFNGLEMYFCVLL